MAKATSALFGSIQQAQASGGIIGLLEDSSIGQYGARVARSAKNLAGTDFIQNTVGVGKWIGQKVAGTQLGGFVGNMGQKAMGFDKVAGRSKKHCRNGNWRRKKSGRPRSIY